MNRIEAVAVGFLSLALSGCGYYHDYDAIEDHVVGRALKSKVGFPDSVIRETLKSRVLKKYPLGSNFSDVLVGFEDMKIPCVKASELSYVCTYNTYFGTKAQFTYFNQTVRRNDLSYEFRLLKNDQSLADLDVLRRKIDVNNN